MTAPPCLVCCSEALIDVYPRLDIMVVHSTQINKMSPISFILQIHFYSSKSADASCPYITPQKQLWEMCVIGQCHQLTSQELPRSFQHQNVRLQLRGLVRGTSMKPIQIIPPDTNRSSALRLMNEVAVSWHAEMLQVCSFPHNGAMRGQEEGTDLRPISPQDSKLFFSILCMVAAGV